MNSATSTSSGANTVDKSGQRVKRMFGEISKRYDLMNHLLSGGVDIYWRKYTVKNVAPQGDAPILDVCTGTGDLAIAYWNAGKRAIPVYGTDFTPEMLEIAKEKFSKLRSAESASIEFSEADTQQLPFPSDHFQIVSVAFGLRNVSDTKNGLNEMIRVCKPGGRVAVLEFSQPTIPGLAGLYRWYFKNVLPRIGQLFARNQEDAYNYLPASVSEFPCGKDLVSIMNSCGLQNTTYTALTFGIAGLYVGTKPE
ncbi:bifunctional demethylmenaquinone methyltransferase/2-methoxy-6-polyprenyl-1,4-benzoquinol methylase UbiE [Planctomicrobium sp. SH668]|uniref:bifunctional demethylmenaquinone methyltransferase/2-methoxy-6-polyprenyl-1,4-benzoquinol methylase UbiE n=1 Tax=Planctomicrobium sp. SH668 TaxID=3448126 RepID=UPI003F5C4E25